MIATEYAKVLIAAGTIYTLATAAGAKIETDPHSSDFGKVRFGKTRVDLLMGLAQNTVLISRVWSGYEKSLKGDIRWNRGDKHKLVTRNTWGVITDFLRSKLSPAIGLSIDLTQGEDVTGKK
jgi:hypothetical protein